MNKFHTELTSEIPNYLTIRENKMNKVPKTSRNLLFSLNNLNYHSVTDTENIVYGTCLTKQKQKSVICSSVILSTNKDVTEHIQ